MQQPTRDNEIDLLEIFEDLWKARWLICVFVVLGIVLGLVFLQVQKAKYKASVSYMYNFYSIKAINNCSVVYTPINTDCLPDIMDQELQKYFDNAWEIKSYKLKKTFISQSPSKDVMITQLEGFNKKLTQAVYEEAVTEVDFLTAVSNEGFLSTEIKSRKLLYAKRIVDMIDNGNYVLGFVNLKSNKIAPKTLLIFIFSTFLGLGSGCLVALVRSAIRNKKNEMVQ